jgi:hypothetical protein
MRQGEKQADSYMQARRLAAPGCRGIALLLVAIAATGCGRAPFGLARTDGGSADVRSLADVIADTGADLAADTATEVPAAGVADAPADYDAVIPPKYLAEPCANASECASGFCADGVCCDSACTEKCKTCAAPSSLGVCAYVASGIVPRDHNDCPATAPATCGLDGKCDGAGACRRYVVGTECGARSCQDSEQANVSTCDGKGSCQPGMLMVCVPYLCDSASGTCFNSCASDAQCSGGLPCTNGSCVHSPDMTCSVSEECASGFCAEGVCCSSACDGPCESCSLVGSSGICTPVAAGTPDPSGICRSDLASTCGQTGLCDGKGDCDHYPQGTMCAVGSCSDGFATPASVCDGKGTCVTGPQLSCGPFGCAPSGSTCSRGCPSGDTICMPDHYCTGDEQCAAKKASGGACASDHECLSGFCANGVCCDSACAGPCASCNQSGSEGRCTLLPNPDGGLACGTYTDAGAD